MSEIRNIGNINNKAEFYDINKPKYSINDEEDITLFQADENIDENEVSFNNELINTSVDKRNEDGMVVSTTYYDEEGNIYKIEKYTYNEDGRKSSLQTYNGDNRLEAEAHYEYYDNGNLKEISTDNYDEHGNLKAKDTYTYYENGNTNTCLSYYYYENGDIKEENFLRFNESGKKAETDYTSYDSDGNETYSKKIKYNQDGNELSLIENKNGINIQTRNTTYHPNGNKANETSIKTDDDGNVIKSETLYDESGNNTDYTEYRNDILTVDNKYLYYPNGNLQSERIKTFNEEGIRLSNYETLYNEYSQETEYNQYDNNDSLVYKEVNEYNENGRLSSMKIYNPDGKIITRTENEYENDLITESTTYDASDKPKEKTQYEYNDNGLPLKITTFNSENKIISEHNFIYDENGNPTHHYINTFDENGNEVFNFEYEYEEVWYYNESAEEYEGYIKEIYNNNADGEIGFSQQGITGDCWLLSGINSLSYSSAGQNLLNNMVNKTENGEYEINFKGVNTTVTITEEELQDARENAYLYSRGDDDVLLLELGFESILNKIQNGEINIEGEHDRLTVSDLELFSMSSLDGGFFEDVIYLMTGEDAQIILNFDENSEKQMNEVLNRMEENPESLALCFSFMAEDNTQNGIITDINGEYIYTVSPFGHAMSIKAVNGDEVTIVNPYDSSKEYIISRDTLIKYANDFEYYKFD